MIYNEKKFGSWRSFELKEHSIVISGKTFFGSRFRMEVDLSKIKPTPDEMSIKDDTRTAYVGFPGFGMFLLGLMATNALYALSPAIYFGVLGFGIAGMLVGFVFGGYVKAYVFRNLNESVVFDLTERGNRLDEFETFAAAIRARAETERGRS